MTACDLLVTGARGFVGAHVWQRASAAGMSVTAANWDLRDTATTADRIADIAPRRVAHLAAAPRGGSPWERLAVDLQMAGALIAALGEHAPGAPLLLPGSAAQYGAGASHPLREHDPAEPVSAYGATKAALEHAVCAPALRGAVRVIWTRSFNHVGPGQGEDAPVAQWARQIAEAERAGGGVLRTGRLDVVRDFLDARDVADAYLALLRSEAEGVINVASGIGVRLQAIVDLLLTQARVPITHEYDPRLMRPVDPVMVVGDCSRLHALTGWTPSFALDRSVVDLLEQWRARCADGAALVASEPRR